MSDSRTFLILYSACAVTYGTLTVLGLARSRRGRSEAWFAAACAITAAWAACFAVTSVVPLSRLSAWLDIGRSALWYGFILYLYNQATGAREQIRGIFQPIGLLILLLLCGIAALEHAGGPVGDIARAIYIPARISFIVCNILLLENLYRNTPTDLRWNVNLLCLGVGGIVIYDLILFADGALFHRMSFVLLEARAPVAMLAAPLLHLAARRNRRWSKDIQVSHDLAFHSFTLVGCGTFLLAVALIGEVLRTGGSKWGSVAETTLIFAAVLAISVVVTSGTARSRIRGLIIQNFFSQRYDYRKEWMRCIDALTAPEAFVALHRRAIRAAAEVVDSPAGALFVRPPQDVAFQWAGSWNMPAALTPIPPGHPIVPLFRDGEWIVRVDQHANAATWFPDLPRAWLVLPLSHFGALIGLVVLAQPRAHFQLDREAYDLLRVIGHEIASRVAEQRAVQVLTQTRDMREYSQRFAFVIHDIKNVSGQLSMLLTNAEVHTDNPDFQRDMLVTVRASVGKISRLLSRLEAERQERQHALVTPAERVRSLIDACRMTHGRRIELRDHSQGAGAGIEPDSFDTVVAHVLNNAAEASPPDRSVTVDLRTEAAGLVIDIIDQGPGMRPEFIRDELFRPLRSTKTDGHGIGAYQARELLRDAGGDLLVLSREGAGTTMRIILPAVPADVLEVAPA